MKVNNLNLSQFIELPDVKVKLRQEFEKPPFCVKRQLLAPVKTSNRSLVGIAFDYLLRFYASYINHNAVSSKWVAEKSLERLNIYKDIDEIIIRPNNVLEIDRSLPKKEAKKSKVLKNNAYSEYKDALDLAKTNYDSYLTTGDMNDDLIYSSIALSKMDPLFIKDYLLPLGRTPQEKNDVEDLRQIVSIINPNTFKAEHTCVLSPNFGPEATKLMSAEGDIVIDDMLIDIKTYENLKLRREIFNQLLAYYTLYRIGGIRGTSPGNKITKLGIYFSRHGYLHTYQVEDVVNESTYLDFIAWFKKRALDFGQP